MKTLFFSTLATFFTFSEIFASNATTPNDSVIVNLNRKSQMIIHKKGNGISIVSDMKSILKDLGVSSIDSAGHLLLDDKAGGQKFLRDTIITFDHNNEATRVIIREKRIIMDNQNARKSSVNIGKGGIHVIDGNDEVHISTQGIHVKDGAENVVIGKPYEKDSAKTWQTKRFSSISRRSGFNMYLGLNTWNDKSQLLTYNAPDLSTLGSRYFAMGWTRSLPLSRKATSALSFDIGLEFTWYNFMFEGDKYISRGANRVEFPIRYDAQNKAISLETSKLTAAYITLPLMPTLQFKNGAITHISLGGYVSYRLDSYSKTKSSDDGHIIRDHNNYYLNDFRYGIGAEIGIKHFPDFFFNYDLNDTFRSGYGPKASAISFGIKL